MSNTNETIQRYKFRNMQINTKLIILSSIDEIMSLPEDTQQLVVNIVRTTIHAMRYILLDWNDTRMSQLLPIVKLETKNDFRCFP